MTTNGKNINIRLVTLNLINNPILYFKENGCDVDRIILLHAFDDDGSEYEILEENQDEYIQLKAYKSLKSKELEDELSKIMKIIFERC